MSARYTIAGGDAGKDRLDVLQRVHGAHTSELLDRVGVPAGRLLPSTSAAAAGT